MQRHINHHLDIHPRLLLNLLPILTFSLGNNPTTPIISYTVFLNVYAHVTHACINTDAHRHTFTLNNNNCSVFFFFFFFLKCQVWKYSSQYSLLLAAQHAWMVLLDGTERQPTHITSLLLPSFLLKFDLGTLFRREKITVSIKYTTSDHKRQLCKKKTIHASMKVRIILLIRSFSLTDRTLASQGLMLSLKEELP